LSTALRSTASPNRLWIASLGSFGLKRRRNRHVGPSARRFQGIVFGHHIRVDDFIRLEFRGGEFFVENVGSVCLGGYIRQRGIQWLTALVDMDGGHRG